MKSLVILSVLLLLAVSALEQARAQTYAPLQGVAQDATQNSPQGAEARPQETTRTGFFDLSPTAAIIVAAAVLLVVILGIVAMTQPPRSKDNNQL